VGRATVTTPELLVDGSDAEFRGFIHDFLAFAARVTEVRAGFGEYLGLTGIGYTTLRTIGHLQGRHGVGVNAVAEHLHLSGAFVTTVVAKLVAAGLVAKRVNSADKRRVLLTVTAGGRRLLDDLAAVQAPVNDALFDCLNADDFRRLKAMLAKLVPCGDRALSLLRYLTQPEGRAGVGS
jgi:DNA-binding MarR family transcriptional regulator